MEQSFIGTTLSLATGVALACYYMLNKKVTRAGSPLQIIFWIFAAHLPPLLVWAVAKQPLHIKLGLFPSRHGGSGSDRYRQPAGDSRLVAFPLQPDDAGDVPGPGFHQPDWYSLTSGMAFADAMGRHHAGGLRGSVALCACRKMVGYFFILAGFFSRTRAPSMALSALCWAVSAPMDKLALRHADPAFHALFVFTGLVFFFLSG